VKRQGTLNIHIIFESVLMPFNQIIIKISSRLSKLQLANVGKFLRLQCIGKAIDLWLCV